MRFARRATQSLIDGPRQVKSISHPASPLLTIDVAHPPRHPDAVEQDILDALRTVRNTHRIRVLKIIHGYGSSGRGGSTKDLVRNWIFRQRDRFKGVIEGERYGRLDQPTQAMRREVGQYADGDLDSHNTGLIVVWVK